MGCTVWLKTTDVHLLMWLVVPCDMLSGGYCIAHSSLNPPLEWSRGKWVRCSGFQDKEHCCPPSLWLQYSMGNCYMLKLCAHNSGLYKLIENICGNQLVSLWGATRHFFFLVVGYLGRKKHFSPQILPGIFYYLSLGACIYLHSPCNQDFQGLYEASFQQIYSEENENAFFIQD